MVAGGAAAWLVHSVLMIVGFVAILSITLTSLQQAILAGSAALLAYFGATVAVLFASFLFGVGLLAYTGGMGALGWQDWSGRAYTISQGTRAKGRAAGVFAIVYGIQGILAIVFLLQLMNAGTTFNPEAALASVRVILLNWTIAAILLVVAASLYLSFVGSLRREVATSESIGGAGLLAYAIVNAIGVFFLTIPLISLLANPLGALDSAGLAIVFLIGLVFELLVVPIIGIVVFSLTIAHGLRLRKLVGGGAPTGMAGAPPAAYGNTSASPAVTQAQPAAWAASPSFVAGPPALEPSSRVPVSAVPPPMNNPVLRLQAQIDELEQAIREEKAFLYDANVGLENGTYDNETHEDLVRTGKRKIAKFEREVGERRAALADRSGILPPPPDDFEDGV